jgi:hypothetical protein
MSKPLCPVCGNPTYSVRTAITPEKSWSEPGPCSMECVQKQRAGYHLEEAETREAERAQFIKDEFERLGLVLARLPDHTLWCVGSMEDGPFARLVVPNPDGSYSGGYREGFAETPADALEKAWLGTGA